MGKIRAVLMDLDGTVYRGQELIPNALETIRRIRNSGLRLFFFTNNSEKSRRMISDKLNAMGIGCSEEDVISAGYACACYVSRENLNNVYVSGTEALHEEFLSKGVNVVPWTLADVLVIGMDYSFNYEKMKNAVNAAIRSKLIISCNKEKTFPCENGMNCPGCGGIVASIEYCSRKTTDVIIGKPGPYMFQAILDITGLRPDEILVVGDTFESDIRMADNCGASSVLVGSIRDDCISVEDIGNLPKIMNKNFEIDLV